MIIAKGRATVYGTQTGYILMDSGRALNNPALRRIGDRISGSIHWTPEVKVAQRDSVNLEVGAVRLPRPPSLGHVCAQSQPLLFLGPFRKCLFCLLLFPGRKILNYRAIKIIQKKSSMYICYQTPVISILCLALDVLYKSSWWNHGLALI